jgi:hypothetical protein
MHEDALHTPAGEGSARHEPTDINTRPLKVVAFVFFISAVVIPLVLLWLFKYYEKTVARPDRELVNSQVPAGPMAPEPRIQGVPTFHGPVPRADMEQLRRESQQRLNSYGKSEDAGFVRIPIDRAMQILADRQMKPTTQKTQ